jgi:hypothetical protein
MHGPEEVLVHVPHITAAESAYPLRVSNTCSDICGPR